MLIWIPAANRYDIHCQRFHTMDIGTVRPRRAQSTNSRLATCEKYFTRAMKNTCRVFTAVNLVMTPAVAAMAAATPGPSTSVAAAGVPMVHPEQWPALQPALAPDPALESRLTTMTAAMTLEQKVGKIIQPDIASITPEDLRHYDLGSILNGGSSSPNGDKFAPPSEWLALADRFYDASMDPAHGAHPIPTLWGTMPSTATTISWARQSSLITLD
jgi:hypothetical protein